MPDNTDLTNKVARLLYTNSGVGLLTLASNVVQRLWKWSRSEQNPTGKATASVVPQHWQPNSGLLMTNDVSDTKPEDVVPCIALSKNDSYVMSACGGKVSLFNMMTFKVSFTTFCIKEHAILLIMFPHYLSRHLSLQVMTTFMPPPAASTFLAFHPQDNNIIAIGMEDSTIHIYNVRVDEVKTKLNGHQKCISGLAFSNNLNILVSLGADAQVKEYPSMCSKLSDQSECDNRVVVDGNLITNRRPETSIEFVQAIVDKFFGYKKALDLARSLVFV
ncbi:topless-related protein 2-like isoform X2 [Asparagus officinalis]|uniref:topless-related protein 2-like isoform X2 n=1 Tax=Asparagus officinalis TaxID=4686 RepID=UPI00098E0A9A|nr:topless-related protein 2-like isoform X2 [Asparagus officinalis]